MLKINVKKKKTIQKMGGNVKLNYISCHVDAMTFLSVSCTSEVRKGKMKNTIQSHVNAIGWAKHKQNNVLFTVVIFLTQSFLSF